MSTETGDPDLYTADGCPVEVYGHLPPGREPDVIAAAVPAGAALLELGCGAGPITHVLRDRGHPVVAVDESAAMLRRVVGVPTVCSRIEDVALGRRFDAVLLTSSLVNTADPTTCAAMLRAAAAHLRPGGSLVVERFTDRMLAGLEPHESARDGIRFVLRDVRREPPGVRAVQEFHFGGRNWSHGFALRSFDVAEFGGAGLVLDRTLTADGSWITAVPAGRGPVGPA